MAQNKEVVITNNGKPVAVTLGINDGDLDATIAAVRQAKAMKAFNAMRARAASSGYFTDEEIDAEIAAVRKGSSADSISGSC